MKVAIPTFTECLLIGLLFLSISTKAQQPCGYEKAREYQLQADPAFKNKEAQTEERIKTFIQNQNQNKLQTGVIDIPIVVHVIHLGEPVGTGSNISNAQILGAIQTLNNMYKSVNGFGVDMQINFCLAVRDPNGNPTTGINRADGSAVGNYATDGMFALQGVSTGTCTNNNNVIKDLSKWPPASYLNIWVVYKYCIPTGWTLYGQASGQTGSVYDGVTMFYTEMAPSKITLGHEIGHMLLLNHTFQGDGTGSTCPVDTSCANNGDLICDTPPHKRGDWGATNPCTALGIWDNSRYNYMAYSWANVPVSFNETNCLFTAGQKARARAAIYSLTNIKYLNSNGCTPPSAMDAGIESFTYPVKTTYTSNCNFPNAQSPVVQLKNYGLSTLSSVTINYRTDNNAWSNYAWSGNLLADSSTNVTLPSLAVTQGAHTFWAYTSNPNGAADGYTLNDSANFAMNYLLQQTSTLSLSASSVSPACFGGTDGSAGVNAVSSPSKFEVKEDWEGSSTDWTIVNGGEVNHWVIGSATSNGGNKSIYVTNDNISNAYQVNASSSVHVYKDFYFPAGATNIKIKFDWKNDGEGGGFNGVDRLRVYLVPTSKVPQPSYQLGIAPQYTATSIGSYYSNPTFKTDSIIGLDLNAGSSKRIVFNWRNNSAAGTQVPAAIDNIIVSYDLPAISAYTYSWTTTPSQSTATASSVGAGTYSVIVTDANNCAATTSVSVTNHAPLAVTITAASNTVCINNSPLTLNGSPAGGTYSGTGVSGNSFDSSVAGVGTFTLTYNYTDMYGCSGSDAMQMTVGACTGINQVSAANGLVVYPNPGQGKLTVQTNEETVFYIVNELGEIILSGKADKENSFAVQVADLSAGIYFLQAQSQNKSFRQKIVITK